MLSSPTVKIMKISCPSATDPESVVHLPPIDSRYLVEIQHLKNTVDDSSGELDCPITEVDSTCMALILEYAMRSHDHPEDVSSFGTSHYLNKRTQFTLWEQEFLARFDPLPRGEVGEIIIKDGGGGYVDPVVTIKDFYYGDLEDCATAVAQVTNGKITGIELTHPGSDYVYPMITVENRIHPARAIAHVEDGCVTHVEVTNPGSGFTKANINIRNIGDRATGKAKATATVVDGRITEVRITDHGSGYIDPEVIIKNEAKVKPAIVTATMIPTYEGLGRHSELVKLRFALLIASDFLGYSRFTKFLALNEARHLSGPSFRAIRQFYDLRPDPSSLVAAY